MVKDNRIPYSDDDDGPTRLRKYFEYGCLCILNGELEKLPESVDNQEAVNYYDENCKCTRNLRGDGDSSAEK